MGGKEKKRCVLGRIKSPASIYPYRKIYPYCKPFIRTTRVYLRRKRLPLAVFPANETPRAHTRGVSL